jgi:hypothetical protein
MNESDRAEAGGSLEHRLVRGGMPQWYLEGLPEREVVEWLDAYWSRDIQSLFRLERRRSFVCFVELVLTRSGGIFEATAFAAASEVSRPTIANYLSVLEITKVAQIIRPFSGNRTNELTRAPKVYGFDTGLIATLRGWSTDPRPEDLGQLWEHYVLNELNSTSALGHVRHWRTTKGQEVDFVIDRPGTNPIAIECKWSIDGREDLRGLKAFRRAHPDGPTFVVGPSVTPSFDRALIGERKVRYVDLASLIAEL